jgi:hypothetical protein
MSKETTPAKNAELQKKEGSLELFFVVDSTNREEIVVKARDISKSGDTCVISVPPNLEEQISNPNFSILLKTILTNIEGEFRNDSIVAAIEDANKDSFGWYSCVMEEIKYNVNKYFLNKKIFDNIFGDEDLKKSLNGITMDTKGFFETLPSTVDNPDLWKTKVFGLEDDFIEKKERKSTSLNKRVFPKIKISFLDEGDFIILHRNTERWYKLLENVFAPDLRNGIFPFFLSPDKNDVQEMINYHKESEKGKIKLSKKLIENFVWPNATYAVDSKANSWPCPNMVIGENESVTSKYIEYLERRFFDKNYFELLNSQKDKIDSQYHKKNKELKKGLKDKFIPVFPIQLGVENKNSHDISGFNLPKAMESGVVAIVPQDTPENYKKLLSIVLKNYLGMYILDQSTVTPPDRAIRAINSIRYNYKIKSLEEKKIYQGFLDWLKNFKIDFLKLPENQNIIEEETLDFDELCKKNSDLNTPKC